MMESTAIGTEMEEELQKKPRNYLELIHTARIHFTMVEVLTPGITGLVFFKTTLLLQIIGSRLIQKRNKARIQSFDLERPEALVTSTLSLPMDQIKTRWKICSRSTTIAL
jgi:hypothetical protein